MRKAIVGIIILVVLIGGGALIYLNNHKSNSSMSGMSTSGSSSQKSSTMATTNVTIANFAFSPASIKVKKGSMVTWTNKDNVAHTVTETDGSDGPKSSNIDQNKSYSFMFNTVGTFHYHCSIHPDMTGTVTVTS